MCEDMTVVVCLMQLKDTGNQFFWWFSRELIQHAYIQRLFIVQATYILIVTPKNI